MDRILVALPPLPEQHRIVSRVDELMGLCNRLLEMHSERENQRDLLTAASHYLLSNGANADAFRKHTHFFIGHLPHLTMRPEQIKHLRKTILNLAVRGKLIPQDLADEPASELLKRIHAYNVNFVGARGRTREMEIFRLHSDSAPFDIPRNWVWVSFGRIMISRDGERIPVSQEGRSGRAKTYDYYGASGVIDKIDGYLFEKPLLLIGEDGANLINRSTPIAFIARGKYWVNNHAHVLDGMSDEFLRFIELYVNATDLRPYVTGTAQPKMNQAKMNSIPVALPPEAEQIRIVARVTELMTLSDRLEGQLATAQTEASRLLESVLHHGLQETLP
jgi:type I restriction enzyme, S subunit